MKRRESKSLEIKENLNLSQDAKALYARTMAGFANHEGGYILFGVRNSPHELIGMSNNNFENLDPAQFQQFLSNHFAPAIDWVHHQHVVGELRFGLIYVFPARVKPIVCQRQGRGDLRDGDIYYRYQGETKRIASAELHQLIQDTVDTEKRSWQEFLKTAATITPATSVVLDTLTGKGATDGRRFIVDERLIEKLKFIQEGRFADDGELALRVIGDVDVARPEAIVVEHEVARDQAIDYPFLTRDVVRVVNEAVGAGTLTTNDVSAVLKRNLNVLARTDWFYRNPVLNSSPQYSRAYIDWIIDQIRRDAEFLSAQRQIWREALAAQRHG